MRIAIAPRVSSDMQAERGWSFEDQLARGQEWAAREGHTVTTVYGQAGVSAGTANRDELLQIVAGAKSNQWDALWIRDLMRFTRSPDDIRHLRAIEFDHGKRIFEDGRPITLLTAEGELDVGVRVQLGAYQLAQIRKLTSHGKRARASAGKPNFSVPPTGYEMREGIPVPRADNAEAVRLIFSLFRTGAFSVRDLVERINAKGYRTNAGRPFGADTINAILRNKFYCGFIGYRGLVPVYTQSKRPRASKTQIEWVRGEHVPLIDEATWLECERIRLARSGQRAGRATKQHRVYLLQGLARCAGCNQPMRAHAQPGAARLDQAAAAGDRNAGRRG
jgi:site-specific DNA recombinase